MSQSFEEKSAVLWLRARKIIVGFLREVRPDHDTETLEHNAAAILARLSHAEPPILIQCYKDAEENEKIKEKMESMTKNDTRRMKSLLRNLDETAKRRDKELQDLSKNPTMLQFATKLMDELVKSVICLAHYESARWGNGNGETPIVDVIEQVVGHMEEGFKKLTGEEYVSEIGRQLEERNRDKH